MQFFCFSVNVDYKYIVQCSAIKSGGPEEWDFLWNRTRLPSMSAADLETAYLSLGCTYDPWLINRYLTVWWLKCVDKGSSDLDTWSTRLMAT